MKGFREREEIAEDFQEEKAAATGSGRGKFVKLLRAARNNHLLKPNHFGQSALFFVVAFFLASLDAAMTMDIVAGWEQEIVCLIDSALVFTEGLGTTCIVKTEDGESCSVVP
nr:hypothetical protein Iba_chr11cCG11740 [Ipomoea batatas]